MIDDSNNAFIDTMNIIVYKQLIILKADDLNYSSGYIIPLGFQRFIDYVEKKEILASLGIIGNSLKTDKSGIAIF